MTTSDNPWTVLSTDRVYDDQWLALDKHRVVNAAGIESRYGVVHHKKLGVRILPIDQDGSPSW
ncbi:hypothetical protein [Microvirga massiliensis]|uniref:hypothetical protein n=1 Tax=Microvirga massiliensis TaxID=1033741 RepID=UPI0006600DC7|nr:hypothetical protein [Microvirga massiliensis]